MSSNHVKAGFDVRLVLSHDASENWNEVLFLDLMSLVRRDELGERHGDGDGNGLFGWIFADDLAGGDDEAADVARLPRRREGGEIGAVIFSYLLEAILYDVKSLEILRRENHHLHDIMAWKHSCRDSECVGIEPEEDGVKEDVGRNEVEIQLRD